VAVADGKGNAPVIVPAPYPGVRKLRTDSFHAVDFGDAVRYGPRASERTPEECLIPVPRLKLLPARHFDREHVISNQQVRHETAFWCAAATGG